MQLIIESATEKGKIPEWGLIEFQGSFLTRENQQIFGEFIGDLNFTKDGIPFFIVGHHILFGEEIKLPKPMAILNKEIDEDTNVKKYLVKAVIRRKVLFKTRPKPIICQNINKNNGYLCHIPNVSKVETYNLNLSENLEKFLKQMKFSYKCV